MPSVGSSYTWRSIMKALSYLKEGFVFRFGKGRFPFGSIDGSRMVECAL